MTGFQLFQHAVLRVFRNLDEALAVSGLIWIAILIVQVLAFDSIDMSAVEQGGMPVISGTGMFLMLLSNVMMAVGSCWVAVEWHRYVLEGRRPTSAFPRWSGSRVWAYFGISILIGLLIGIFVAVLAGVLLSLFGAALAATLGGLFLLVVIGLPAVYAFFRIAPVLPAAALARKMKFAEAWEATKPHSGTIMQAAVLSILALMLVQLPSIVLGEGIVALIYELVAGWAVLMVNVSLLSSIYELAERGPIDD